MTKTCFITTELYPQDLGGIGRLMHNIVHYNHAMNPSDDLHIVMACQKQDATQELFDDFNGIAQLHFLETNQDLANILGVATLENAVSIKNLKEPFLLGLRIMQTVIRAENSSEGKFDHIEIPDHMGLGDSILTAKKAGIAFETTEITCRIHSSLSAIIEHEPFYHQRSNWLAPRLDMERRSLRDADRIIAHLPVIAKYTQSHFQFCHSWEEKVEICFPPTVWPPKTGEIGTIDENADFIFSSRFQPFKRPELFIKAAVNFLQRKTGYSGNFRLISYGFDQSYIDDLRLQIPSQFRNRIRIETNVSSDERARAIASGIVVHPSAFESLCAMAYEVSAGGRPILLAKDCLAFGSNDRWKDTENCLMFEPLPEKLADVMGASLTWRPTSIVDFLPDQSYLQKPAKPAQTTAAGQDVAVLVGPLRCRAEFQMFNDLALGAAKVMGFGLEEHISDFDAEARENIISISSADFQGRQIRQIAKMLGCPVIIATPNSPPSPEFIRAGLKCIRRGLVFSSNSKNPEGRMNIYPGKMPSVLASDYRFAPLCLMFHSDDLSVFGDTDDKDILLRALARVADSKLDVMVHPYPLIVEIEPLIDTPPNRRILGFEAAPAWQNSFRKIGIDVKLARFSELLVSRPANFLCENQSGAFEIDISPDAPALVEFSTGEVINGQIVGVQISHTGSNGEVDISMHQCAQDEALIRHNNRQQIRKIRFGQSYQMRWGPMMSGQKPVMAISASHETRINIGEFFIISRE